MVLHRKILVVSVLSLCTLSCGMVNEDEVVVPAYVYVPSFTFETNPDNSQGANSQAFNDMWISEGGILRGAIGLPSLLPLQTSGPTEVRIDAGISNTGQDNSRMAYPFMASYIETRNLKPGVIDTIRPVFKYLAGAGFKFIEDFDRVTRAFEFNPAYAQPGDTLLPVSDNDTLKPGEYYGKIDVPKEREKVQLVTKEEYELNGFGSPAFLEIDYKSNMPLDIGYYYFEPNQPVSSDNSVVLTYPSDGWKKLYVDLSNETSIRKAGTKYVIYIAFFNPNHITPQVYIDNVKLLYLK